LAFNDLATMIAYFAEQHEKINRLIAEIDEINQGITAEYVEAQDETESAIANAVSLANDHLAELDPSVRGALEARLPAMREAKTARRAELEKSLSDLQADRAEIEQKDTAELDKLAEENPNLNEREEILKRKLAEAQAAVTQTEDQMRQAGAGLGWLLHASEIGRLRKQHQVQATSLYGVRERLSEVRTTWAKDRTAAQETQQRLQQAWRLRTAEIAKQTQELDDLASDFEGTCRRAAIEEWVRAQETFPPTGVAEVDSALGQIVTWRKQGADCESGVVAVSEIMGLLKGVGDGLARMQTSIESLKKEQDMHAELATLHIEAPPAFLQFHQFWDALMETVRDEKRSIEHPKAFADIIHQVIGSTLSNENIEAMFNLAGNTLTEATKQWD
jgi:myosin heavy subunit